MKLFRKSRKEVIDQSSSTYRFKKYLLYAIGEIILVVIGILVALWINDWNEDRIAADRESEVAQLVLKQMKSDLKEITAQLVYLNEQQYLYDIILKEREPTDEERILVRFKAPELVTIGFEMLTLEPKALKISQARMRTRSKLSEQLDSVETVYSYGLKVLDLSESLIVEEILNNLNHLKENYDWYYTLISSSPTDVNDYKYFQEADYRNRVAQMYLIAYTGYETEIMDLHNKLTEQVQRLEVTLE